MSLAVGQVAEVRRRYSAADIDNYVALGGHRPAGDSIPEPLVLPGQGTNYLKQESEFFETAGIGDELRARVEITRLRPEKHFSKRQESATNCARGSRSRDCGRKSTLWIYRPPV
jgi:hypothetical protein